MKHNIEEDLDDQIDDLEKYIERARTKMAVKTIVKTIKRESTIFVCDICEKEFRASCLLEEHNVKEHILASVKTKHACGEKFFLINDKETAKYVLMHGIDNPNDEEYNSMGTDNDPNCWSYKGPGWYIVRINRDDYSLERELISFDTMHEIAKIMIERHTNIKKMYDNYYEEMSSSLKDENGRK